ncbi:hypothetical protein [Streptomyces spectabilis]|uniref:FlgD Ig-like domain-containing protein n=1 Tax=Streptomyces spectabilis TaxID=68270 RepID=A0A516R9M8_STRST|nr:hypothetical protein [Streptomyces spectabilis]QDQ12368.1 hypothetical protein FH965_18825 [Streptomyces spectabilis]
MARHASSRGRVAVAATLALSAGPLALAVPSAVAAPAPASAATAPAGASAAPAGTVVDAADRFEPRGESLYGAGRTGYLHREESDGPGESGWGTSDAAWTEYGTGRTRPVARLTFANGPIAALLRPGHHMLDLTDLDTGESATVTAPPRHYLMTGAATDRTAVSSVRDHATGTLSLHLLRAEADGATSDRTVTGLPDDMTSVHRVRTQDRESAVLVVDGPGARRAFLLDYRSGAATRLFPGLEGDALPTSFALSPDRVLGYWSMGEAAYAYTVERGAPDAAPVRTRVPGTGDTATEPRATMALAGDRILVARDEPRPQERVGRPLQAVRVGADGADARAETLLKHAGARLTPAPDGSVLAVGGTGAADWAVHRVTAKGADGVRLSVVREIAPVRARIDGLALGGGRLTVATAGGGATGVRTLRAFDLSVIGTPKAVARPEHDSALPDRSYARCAEGEACVDLRALGNGRVAYSTGDSVREPTSPDTHRTVAPGLGRVDLVDASGRYTLLDRRGSAQFAVGDSESRTPTRVVRTFKASAAALWGTKVWQPGKKAGTVVPYDLKSGKTGAAVALGARCTPNDLQVVGRWLYWECGGKARVRDLTAKKDVALPHRGGLLGDGFLVRQDGARLDLVDFHKGAGTRVTTKRLASVPEDARPGVTWTVDRFGGHVAYVDAAQRVRIAPVPVARSPIASLESRADSRVSAAGKGGTWRGRWQLSRPAAAWKVTFKDASGRTSGSVRGTAHDGASVAARWHARTRDGAKPRSGRHTWTLTVKDSGDTAYRTLKTGTLDLTGGR